MTVWSAPVVPALARPAELSGNVQGARLRQRTVRMFRDALETAYDSCYAHIDAACSARARA